MHEGPRTRSSVLEEHEHLFAEADDILQEMIFLLCVKLLAERELQNICLKRTQFRETRRYRQQKLIAEYFEELTETAQKKKKIMFIYCTKRRLAGNSLLSTISQGLSGDPIQK